MRKRSQGGENDGPDTDPGEAADEEGFTLLPDGEPVVLPIEPVLDLHSFQPSEIESVLEEYLLEALRAGLDEIRIIHGRGIGVQREIVRAVLLRTPFVISFRDARPESGGWGATVAWLQRG